jgi:hypothetical protein
MYICMYYMCVCTYMNMNIYSGLAYKLSEKITTYN